MSELTDWADSVVNRYIDVDATFGNQCWDASQSWLFAVAGPGATLWTQPSEYPGLAAGCWEVIHSDTWPGPSMRQYLTPIPGDQPGQPGDVIIWNYGARLYPISHTAVLLEDRGANLYTVSQNSSAGQPGLPGYSPETTGPTIYQLLPREGIAGFLRPNVLSTLSGTINPIEGFLMALSDDEQRRLLAAADRINGTIPDRRDDKGNVQTVLLSDDGAYIIAQMKTLLTRQDGDYLNQALLTIAKGVGDLKNRPTTTATPLDVKALAAELAPLLTTNQAHQFIVALGQALPKQ